MSRAIISIALSVNVLLVACGNKGDLFLEADNAVAEEIKQLDESLDEIEEDSENPSKKKDKKTAPAAQ